MHFSERFYQFTMLVHRLYVGTAIIICAAMYLIFVRVAVKMQVVDFVFLGSLVGVAFLVLMLLAVMYCITVIWTRGVADRRRALVGLYETTVSRMKDSSGFLRLPYSLNDVVSPDDFMLTIMPHDDKSFRVDFLEGDHWNTLLIEELRVTDLSKPRIKGLTSDYVDQLAKFIEATPEFTGIVGVSA